MIVIQRSKHTHRISIVRGTSLTAAGRLSLKMELTTSLSVSVGHNGNVMICAVVRSVETTLI